MKEVNKLGHPNPPRAKVTKMARLAAWSGEAIEGMTEAEAAALLDSLRGKETLLPFNDQGARWPPKRHPRLVNNFYLCTDSNSHWHFSPGFFALSTRR